MNKIVLLGHGVGVKRIIDTVSKDSQLKSEIVAVVTHPFEGHKRDFEMIEQRKQLYADCAYNVFNVTEDYNIPLHEADNVNNEESIDWIDNHEPDYLISVGCRDILKKPFLQHYSGKVFNIHTTPLPKYRGAASDTWMILNSEFEKDLYGCFHEIDAGIDTGRILAKTTYSFPKSSYPIDVFKVRMSIFPTLITKSILKLNSGNLDMENQDMDDSTTFPRLYTPIDGKIDFKLMDGLQIERFIYGFGYPFEGAHCQMGETKINIMEASYFNDSNFHPLTYGIIFGKNKNHEYKISVKGGYMLIKKIEIDGKQAPQNEIFKLGRKLI